MRREIKETVELKEGVTAKVDDRLVILTKNGKEIAKKYEGFQIKSEADKLILFDEKATKNRKKMIKTLAAHLRNAVKGLSKDYEYTLKVCYVHFPVTLEQKGKEIIIKNFLGEKVPRIAKIPEGAIVKIDKDVITITSHDKEIAGQAAANIEKTTKVRYRDRRVFQDGIFITKKEKGK